MLLWGQRAGHQSVPFFLKMPIEDYSQKLADRLLQGWGMMDICCPNSSVSDSCKSIPLMKKKNEDTLNCVCCLSEYTYKNERGAAKLAPAVNDRVGNAQDKRAPSLSSSSPVEGPRHGAAHIDSLRESLVSLILRSIQKDIIELDSMPASSADLKIQLDMVGLIKQKVEVFKGLHDA